MKLRFRLAVLAFVLFGASASVPAEEVTLEFLHALQKNGYEDIAVEHLKTLQKQPNLPAELRDVFDLELSNSLRGAANRAYDAKEKDQMMADSQASLEKFLKEKPDHPAAISAMVSASDLAIDRAQKSLRSAKYLAEKDQDQKAKYLAEARTSLEDAQKKLKTAAEKFRVRLAALPEVPKTTGKNRRDVQKAQQAREAAAQDYVEAVGKSSMVQYFLAQTFADPNDPQRKKILTDAAKAFDEIYQKRRLEIAGLFAHMWHGKCMEEAGDTRLALDIYDEVLANAPDPGEASADPALEPVFAQVEYFRLLILAKQKPAQFLAEAEQWLKAYKKIKATGGYQGITLEVAKAKLAASEKAAGAEKAKLKQDATALLRDMRKVPSMYQQEAVQMMLQLGGGEASSFDDALVLGNEAAEAKRWSEAIDNYRKALAFSQKTKIKETEKVGQTREALAQCMLVVARQNFSKNQLEECLVMASTLIKELGTEPPAALAISSLGVYAALNLYANTPEAEKEKKEAALQRLSKIASFVISTWPAKPEADDARMALANSKLVVGEIDEALKRFDEVNPKSERHPQALYYAGRTYWGRYQAEKVKPEDKRNKEQMTSDRTKAQERLLASLEAQRKPPEANKKEEPKKQPPEASKKEEPEKPEAEAQDKEADAKQAAEEKTAQLVAETQLMLGEILVESGQPKDAVGYFQPLMDGLDKEKTKSMDPKLLLRIYVGAFKSYLAAGELAKAGESGAGLADAAADSPFVNGWLMDFARQLNDEYKKAEAERIGAADATQKDAANEKLKAVKEPLGKVLAKLGERQVSGKGLMFVADTLAAVGLTDEATKVYDEILKKLEDADFAKSVGATAPTRARTQLIEIESTKGNYAKALKEVDKLIADNERALEPRMTKGRILQQWCEKDPSHYPEAVRHWAKTRDLLQRMKKKPPELIEVVYNIAACLLYQARSEKDKATAVKRALEGEQVLKAMLFNNPTLDKRPDMVARYKELLAKLATLQGRKPTPDKPATGATAPAGGKPAPSPAPAAKKS
ncbi:MAG: hypothetical protein NTY19_47000 [Planctomycetota bacterium]|nr:hypothetical protein [Planctomycetota bacterium]